MRAVYGAVAAVFAIAVLVLLHVVAFQLLARVVAPWLASLIVLAVDLVVAGIFGYLAMSNTPDPIEVEAKQVRQQAIIEMRKSLTVMAMAAEVSGLVLRRNRTGTVRMLGGIAARVLARR